MKIFLVFVFLVLFGQISASIKIDSVSKLPSRCLNSGSMTVYVSSSSQVIYSYELSGIASSNQSANLFSNLAPGIYKVKAVNLSNEKDSINIRIDGNYSTPDFAQIVTSTSCTDNSDGKIIGNSILNKGLKPFIWTLKNNNTNTTITQSNDTFKNLIKGDYSLTLTDSCMNTTVHNFAVGNTPSSLKINYGGITNKYCSQFSAYFQYEKTGLYYPHLVKYEYNGMTIYKNINGTNNFILDTLYLAYKFNKSLKITLYNPCGDSFIYSTFPQFYSPNYQDLIGCDTTKLFFSNYIGNFSKAIFNTKNGTTIFNSINSSSFFYNFINLTHNDTINYKLINNCNDTVFGNYLIPSIRNLYGLYSNLNDSACSSKYEYKLALLSTLKTLGPINIRLIDKLSGNILIDSNIKDTSSIVFKNFPTNKNYLVIINNKCGLKDTLLFYWNSISNSKYAFVNYYMYDVCTDSTVTVAIQPSGFIGKYNIQILSGPLTIQNTKPFYSFVDSLNYSQAKNKPGESFYFANFGLGKYYYKVWDSCSILIDSFEIVPDLLANNFYKYTPVKACQDNNQINLKFYSIHQNNWYSKSVYGSFSIFDVKNGVYLRSNLPIKFSYDYINGFSYLDSFKYLTEGKYVLKINYTFYNSSVSNLFITKNQKCTEVIDTLIIPKYIRPNIQLIAKATCNNLKHISLISDSTVGIAPYRYEINQGPQTFPIQSSNRFVLSQQGNYQAKIWDTCGNATTINFIVDTFNFDPIYTNDTSCSAQSVKLAFDYSPLATYRWQRPDSSFYFGDTLSLNPVLLKDIGVYKITKFVSISGCIDSFSTNYNLIKSKEKKYYDTIIEGDSSFFKTDYKFIAGIYRDTISKLPCDSIDILYLKVKDTILFDTVRHYICFTDSINFRGKFYKMAGTYSDTVDIFNKPDSGYVLILTVKPFIPVYTKFDTIFEWDSVYFKNRFLKDSGTYRDTIHILPCDSIVIFNLQIKDTLISINSILRLCMGDSVLFRGNYYRTSGTYTDFVDIPKKPDTLFKLVLNVNPLLIINQYNLSHCNKFNYNSASYFNDTLIVDSIKSSLGCDSILNKTQHKVFKTKNLVDSTISSCDFVLYKSKYYYQSNPKLDSILVKFKSNSLCDSLKQIIHIHIKPKPILTLTSSKPNLVDFGDTIKLTASGGVTYRWNTNESFLPTISYFANRNKSFQLIGTSADYCNDTLNYRVLMRDSAYYTVSIPTAFSPNGDGNNDQLYIRLMGAKRLLSFKIFNRLGQLIFYTKDENQGWDGYYKSVMQNSEVYFYSYEIETIDNKKKGGDGNFILLR